VTARALPVGSSVRVREGTPLWHQRTPAYLQGRVGVVERFCGAFPEPGLAACHRGGGSETPLYRVRFRMADLWQAAESPADSLEAELFADWLEPVPER